VGTASRRRQPDVAIAAEADGAAVGVVIKHDAVAADASLASYREAASLEVIKAGQQRDGSLAADLDAADVRPGRQGERVLPRVVDGRVGRGGGLRDGKATERAGGGRDAAVDGPLELSRAGGEKTRVAAEVERARADVALTAYHRGLGIVRINDRDSPSALKDGAVAADVQGGLAR